jgi:hypothetical protein
VVIGVLIGGVLILGVVISLFLLVRDVGRLHHGGRSLTDAPGNAAGVSPAGMTVIGNNLTH